MTIFAVFVLAVLGLGNTTTANGTDSAPQDPSRTYPVRLEGTTGKPPRVAVPRPTMSYPIKFDTPRPRPPAPQPTVSYPIDLSALRGQW